MASITVNNVSDDIKGRLCVRTAGNGRAMESGSVTVPAWSVGCKAASLSIELATMTVLFDDNTIPVCGTAGRNISE